MRNREIYFRITGVLLRKRKIRKKHSMKSTSPYTIYNYSDVSSVSHTLVDETSMENIKPETMCVSKNKSLMTTENAKKSSKRKIFDFPRSKGPICTASLTSLQSAHRQHATQDLSKTQSSSALLRNKDKVCGNRSVSFNPRIFVREFQNSNEGEGSDWQRYFSCG